jgi:hypothetical protein
LAVTFENDVYSKHAATLPAADAAALVDAIYPATEAHIAKHRAQESVVVVETAADFARVHAPLIKALPPSRTAWVDNILDGSAEADRVIASDPDPVTGWVLLPDMKWDRAVAGARVYAVAILRDRALTCLRDISATHADALEAAAAACVAALGRECGVAANKVGSAAGRAGARRRARARARRARPPPRHHHHRSALSCTTPPRTTAPTSTSWRRAPPRLTASAARTRSPTSRPPRAATRGGSGTGTSRWCWASGTSWRRRMEAGREKGGRGRAAG